MGSVRQPPFWQGADRWYSAAHLATLSLASLVCLAAAPARAQDVINKEGAAVVKASFLNDLETLRGKFVGLAEAFPQDKYTWRPMDGVRSVSEVLMLAAMEGYSFIPNSFGAKPADIAARRDGQAAHAHRQGAGHRAPEQGLRAREEGARGPRPGDADRAGARS